MRWLALLAVAAVGCGDDKPQYPSEPPVQPVYYFPDAPPPPEPEFVEPEPIKWQQEGPQKGVKLAGGGCECKTACPGGQGPAAFSVTLGGTLAGNGTYTVPCIGDCRWGWVNPSPVPCGIRSIEVSVVFDLLQVNVKYAALGPGPSFDHIDFAKGYAGGVPCGTLANDFIPRLDPQIKTGYCNTGFETCTISSF